MRTYVCVPVHASDGVCIVIHLYIFFFIITKVEEEQNAGSSVPWLINNHKMPLSYACLVRHRRHRRMGTHKKKEMCNNDDFDETRDANGSGTHSLFEPAVYQRQSQQQQHGTT